MVNTCGNNSGVESMLGTLLETSELDEGKKPRPQQDLHQVIMRTLAAHGLHATAQCLRSEADLEDLPVAARFSKAHSQKMPEAAGEHAQQINQERVRVVACFEEVSEQRQRLDELRSTVQRLREAQGGIGAIGKGASGMELHSRRIEELNVNIQQLKDMELPSREELRAKEEEAILLKQLLSAKLSGETDLRHKLQLAKEEVARLRCENGS